MINLNKKFASFQRIPATAKIFLLQNLSVMVRTGIPLASSLKTLEEQTKNKKLKLILNDVSEKIKQGKTFGESLTPYEKDFGELFLNMIKAGEASGNLEEVLNKLYIQIKKDHQLKTKVRGAMTYPSIIVVAMIGISAFVIFFVLPNITVMFKDLNVALPLPTRILIGISDFVQGNGVLTVLTFLITVSALAKIITTKKGKFILDQMILRLPIISPIVQKVNLARMARSLSSLLKTDIAIADSFTITSKVLGNSLYKKAVAEAAEKVKKGEKLETIFKAYPQIFPPVIIQMISVGEETGALDEILENLAGFYEEEVDQTMEALPTIIEPILMILIAIGVAGIALAIMLPIYSLTETF